MGVLSYFTGRIIKEATIHYIHLVSDTIFMIAFVLLVFGGTSANLIRYRTATGTLHAGAFASCVQTKDFPEDSNILCSYDAEYLNSSFMIPDKNFNYTFKEGADFLISEANDLLSLKGLPNITSNTTFYNLDASGGSLYFINALQNLNIDKRGGAAGAAKVCFMIAMVVMGFRVCLQPLNFVISMVYLEYALSFISWFFILIGIGAPTTKILADLKDIKGKLDLTYGAGFSLCWAAWVLSFIVLVINGYGIYAIKKAGYTWKRKLTLNEAIN